MQGSSRVVPFICRLWIVHRVSSSLLGPVVPSFRALSGRLTFYGPTSQVQYRVASRYEALSNLLCLDYSMDQRIVVQGYLAYKKTHPP